ncbi:hypothetical protein ABGN05_01600 [Aquibium sp. LZ166]|uniref:Flagellar hook-length control protein FliK n=1 Tax=Aquibium pacificus TaxID=3153579 RepID=A0ABV3SC87_9HYPH
MTLTTVISQPRPVGSATSQARKEAADPNAFSEVMGAQSNQTAAGDDGGSEAATPTITASWTAPTAGAGPEDLSGLPVEIEDELSGLPVELEDQLSDLPETEDELSGLPVEKQDDLSGLPVEAEGPVASRPSVSKEWVGEAATVSSSQGAFAGDMAFETVTSLLGRYATSPAAPYQAASK